MNTVLFAAGTFWPPLLANEIWKSLGDQFRGENAQFDLGKATALLLVAGSFVFLFWGLSLVLARQERSQNSSSPKNLLRALCQAHGLSRSDRWILTKLADHYKLRSPVFLFLQPERFVVEELPASLAKKSEEVERIQAVLFADPLSSDSSSPLVNAE